MAVLGVTRHETEAQLPEFFTVDTHALAFTHFSATTAIQRL